jgi:hypothetical protein
MPIFLSWKVAANKLALSFMVIFHRISVYFSINWHARFESFLWKSVRKLLLHFPLDLSPLKSGSSTATAAETLPFLGFGEVSECRNSSSANAAGGMHRCTFCGSLGNFSKAHSLMKN